jgi:hypothetical protein
LSLHSSEASQGIDLSCPLFTCTNANQAATYTCNTRPRVSPHHVVNHSSQPGGTIHRSSDAPVLNPNAEPKELLTGLQTELELKKVRKAELEAELRTLTAEIEAGEKKMAELPESMERIRKEATATLSVGKQLKTTRTVLNINDQTVWSRYMQIWSRNIFYDQLMT